MTRHTWRAVATACAAGALVVGPLAVGSTAAAPDSGSASPHELGIEQKVDPGISGALERDLGISRGDAAARLTFQARAAGDRGRPRATARCLVRRRVGRSDEERAVRRRRRQRCRGCGPGGGREGGRRRRHVGRARGLAGVARRGEPRRARPGPQLVRGRRHQPVVVSVRPGGEATAQALVERAGVAAESVSFEATTEAPAAVHRRHRRQRLLHRRGSRCSVGFSVNGGFVTAGHCGTHGRDHHPAERHLPRLQLPRQRLRLGPGRLRQHPARRWSTTTPAAPSPSPARTDAAVGASVCRSGSTTGWHCGTIQARNSLGHLPAGHRQRPHPHQRLRRARRLRWLAHRRQPGTGRHLRRIGQLLLRRHDVLPAGQRDPVRPTA